MSSSADVKKKVLSQGPSAFERAMPFDEVGFLRGHRSWIDTEGLDEAEILECKADLAQVKDASKAGNALPGHPTFLFYARA